MAFGGGTIKKWFPLVGAAQSRVSDSPLPAEGEGDICLRQTPFPSRNALFLGRKHKEKIA